ncbi:MAG: outer membrane beta-barrel protein [Gemmatimonadales bacterium]|nr:outer membrane beta-barrel protein [Gemmatimonadales bacterium]
MSRGINPKVWSVSLIFVLICAICAPLTLFAQDEVSSPAARKYRAGSGPAGTWVGEIKSPDGEKFEIRLQLDKVGEEWKGLLEDPFLGPLPANRLLVTASRISFTFRPEEAAFPSHFSGIYLAGDDRVTGTISQRGSSVMIKFNRDPDSILMDLTDSSGEPIIPTRVRHPYRFAVTGRFGFWPALHVLKEETYNINNLTTKGASLDGTLKFFVLDEFNIFVRGFRGGLNFTDDEKINVFQDIGLSPDSSVKLDGFEVGVMGYFGNLLLRDSKFNPYLTGSGGKTSWELNEGGRGSDVVNILFEDVIGTDWAFAAGFGTEYEVRNSLCLEVEFLWRYFMTQDEEIWEDYTNYWTNTHAWSFSFGLTWGIW